MTDSSRYQRLPDRGDGGVTLIAHGSTAAELFENAAYGAFDVVYAVRGLVGRRDVPVVAAGDSLEDLLVDWITELFAQAVHLGLVLCSFTVDRLEEGGVQGSASGVPDPRAGRERFHRATRRGVTVVPIPDGWWARLHIE